jgi:hypothetical protein
MREWIKLYTEIAHDRKMCLLTDRQFRVCINLFALAGIEDDSGVLPSIADIAFQLRLEENVLLADMNALLSVDILTVFEGVWMIAHWHDRQAKPPSDSQEAILARVHKHRAKMRNEGVTPFQNVTENVTTCNEPVTPVTTREREREREKERDVVQPLQNPGPVMASGNGNGRKEAARMSALNNKLGPQLRRVLADALLQITGNIDLANTETDAGQAALYAAHEAAIAVYQMGHKTAEDLLPAEDAWYESDFRGKRGERPTLKQFVEQCSKTKAQPRQTGTRATEEWR